MALFAKSGNFPAEPTSPASAPLILTVPGLHDSGPRHWQSAWERSFDNCERVDLGMWDNPHRNTWVNKLNLAIHRAEDAGRPVILAAHSLGCLAVAWWAEYEQPGPDSPVIGALLVAPPDVDRPGADPRLARFSACPRTELPFPGFLVASRNDPWCSRRTAYGLARDWGCRFADAGDVGHINADSGLGQWAFGQALLNQLLRENSLGLYVRSENLQPQQAQLAPPLRARSGSRAASGDASVQAEASTSGTRGGPSFSRM